MITAVINRDTISRMKQSHGTSCRKCSGNLTSRHQIRLWKDFAADLMAGKIKASRKLLNSILPRKWGIFNTILCWNGTFFATTWSLHFYREENKNLFASSAVKCMQKFNSSTGIFATLQTEFYKRKSGIFPDKHLHDFPSHNMELYWILLPSLYL